MPDSGKILFFDPLDTPAQACSPDTEPGDRNAADTLAALVRIISECGLDPVTQLAGYLMTDDPTYLPDSAHARAMADRIGRDKLLETLILLYLDHQSTPAEPRV